jgi:two-component system, cell cycle response regulator DivK
MPRLLLIEDNDLNRDMLSRRLRRRGYEVDCAADGATGVSQARADCPDLVVMDLGLPVMDGWEATRLLKAAPETCDVPVIALTAHALPGEEAKARAAGCDDYDTKPVELARLIGKIEQLLAR